MAEMNQIKCPHCGQTYAVRPDQWAQYQGRTINCTKCGQPFAVSGPPEAVAPQTAPAAVTPSMQPPMMPPQTPVGYSTPGGYGPGPMGVQPTQGNGWAITSLIFGIVSFCLPVLGSVVAIVTGIVGLTKTRDPRVGGKGPAIAGITLGGLSLLTVPLIIAILLPSLNRAREMANRVKCAANMRQLGTAMMMYANNNNGHFPDKFEDVLQASPDLSAATFVCPSDDKLPPSTTSVQTEEHDIASGKHCSYVYIGADLTSSASPDTVLLYEPLTDHRNQGINVLFADGHVEFLATKEAQSIIKQHGAGTGPIKLSSP
ncbi:MAG TPA: DUF4190 domain-containing protein [Tepidisphaeraceae bacterium]|nr:DUF4190 domain-containing protein [Tepidisphaeraceae bacterium]